MTIKIGIAVKLWLLKSRFCPRLQDCPALSINPWEISKLKFDTGPFSMANDNISSLWRLRVLSYHHQGLKHNKHLFIYA